MLRFFYFFTFSALFLPLFATAQTNLVQNGNFEAYKACPVGFSRNNTQFDAVMNSWYEPNEASSDYFNRCGQLEGQVPNVLFGNEQPHSGDGFMGLGWYGLGGGFYDYAQVELSQALVAGKSYDVGVWVSKAENVQFASDDIGIYLSNGAFYAHQAPMIASTPARSGVFTTLTPQVKQPDGNFVTETNGWTLIKKTITAVGGEKFMTLGCFEAWATTGQMQTNPSGDARCYYYFDDAFVTENTSTPVDDFPKGKNIGHYNSFSQTFELQPTESLKNTRLQLFDALGRNVKTLFQGNLESNQTFDLNGMKGMYFLRLESENCREIFKVQIF